MSFLDFPGLQYFYNKYLKPIKPHAREETIKSYTVNEQGHVPDAQLVAQLKEENESLQAKVEALNSALGVKVYSGESQINGFESWAVVDNHTVTFCIRGTISTNLGTSNQYAFVASFPQLKNLITLNRLRLKRIEITPTIKGQIRFEQDTGILNIGYTYNNSGESIDIPKGVVLYLEETFVL